MKIDREEFMAQLALVKPALASGGVVPELSHIWFDKAHAYAFDGGFGIKRKLTTDLTCGLPGKPLLDLLSTSKLKEAELVPNGNALAIKLGKAQTKLVALDLERRVWPYPVKLPRTADPVDLGEDFIEGLRKTLFIKASPATRVEHHGVMVAVGKTGLCLYATDSATMARVLVKGAGKGAAFDKVLLPRTFAEQIVSQAPEGVKLIVASDCLIAEAEGVTFYSNLLDVSGADDMDAIISKQLAKHPEPLPLPAGLEGALARAEILAGAGAAAVEVAVVDGELKLSGSYGLGTLQENLELDGEAPNAKMRLSAGLLKRALPYAESFSLTAGSLILRGEPDFVYVLASL